MATKAVTAEAFWMAFQSLSGSEQKAVVERLLQDENFREDLLDIALIERRRTEPSRPLREYHHVGKPVSRLPAIQGGG